MAASARSAAPHRRSRSRVRSTDRHRARDVATVEPHARPARRAAGRHPAARAGPVVAVAASIATRASTGDCRAARRRRPAVRAREKRYAPPFMMLGINLENTDVERLPRRSWPARYLAFDVLGSGSELRIEGDDRLGSLGPALALSSALRHAAVHPHRRRRREEHHRYHPGRRGGGGVQAAAAVRRRGSWRQSVAGDGAHRRPPLRASRRRSSRPGIPACPK